MKPAVISLAEAKAEKERKAYAALVLSTFDQFEHTIKREQLERRVQVELAARERI